MITAETGDLACDPRSGGIAGNDHIALYYGVKGQQFRRNIRPGLSFMQYIGDLPVTNVLSAEASAAEYRRKVYEARCDRLGIEPVCSY